MKKVCVYGAGAWGTALALSAQRAGREVTLQPRRAEQAELLTQQRENTTYLPGIEIPQEIYISADHHLLKDQHMVLLVTPAQKIRETCQGLQSFLPKDIPLVICSKGIDLEEKLLLTQVIGKILPNPLAVLSGPSFADEVAQNLPTAVTIASESLPLARNIAAALRHSFFRCYASDDPLGVQVSGALKNVLAIGCGIVHGRKFGNNAAAAFITRGLAEMRRLGLKLGGKSETFLGLSAVGDLTLTCSSVQSRNMSLGKALGEGQSLSSVLAQRSGVTEGMPTSAAVFSLAETLDVSMPISRAVHAVLHKGVTVDQVIQDILSAQSVLEFESPE